MSQSLNYIDELQKQQKIEKELEDYCNKLQNKELVPGSNFEKIKELTKQRSDLASKITDLKNKIESLTSEVQSVQNVNDIMF